MNLSFEPRFRSSSCRFFFRTVAANGRRLLDFVVPLLALGVASKSFLSLSLSLSLSLCGTPSNVRKGGKWVSKS